MSYLLKNYNDYGIICYIEGIVLDWVWGFVFKVSEKVKCGIFSDDMSNIEFWTLKTISLLSFNHSASPTVHSCADKKSKKVITHFLL